MSMRITNNMMIARNLRNQNANLYRMSEIQHDIDSTVTLHKASDDPIKVTRVLRLRSDLRLNEQYQENINEAKAWLSVTDSSLDEINKVVKRLSELATQAASDTFSPEDRQKVKQEVEQMKAHVVTVANQTLTGRYIFSGYKTNVPLLQKDGKFNAPPNPASPAGSEQIDMTLLPNQDIELHIGDQQKFAMNITGDKVFRRDPAHPEAPKIIRDIDTFLERLQPPGGGMPVGTEITKSIGDMKQNLDDVLEVRGEVGAKVKTIEVIEERMTDDNLNLKKLISETQDTKMAEAYTKLMTAESVYRASLAVAARIIQPTLVDFLR